MWKVEWTVLQNNLPSLWFSGHAWMSITVNLIALKKTAIDYIHLLHFFSISKCLGKQPTSDYRNISYVGRNIYVCVIVLPGDTGNNNKWVQLTKGLFKICSSGSYLQIEFTWLMSILYEIPSRQKGNNQHEEIGPILIKELLKFRRMLLQNHSLHQQIINPSLVSYPRISILLLPCCSSAPLWLGVSTPDSQHTFRPGSRQLWTSLCTSTLPQKIPSLSHHCLSLQKNPV